MTINFRPDISLPHDPAGWGYWLIGHYLEHKTFITKAHALTPPVQVSDYNLLQWEDRPSVVGAWLNVHARVHEVLRVPAGFSGIDLSAVDLTDDEAWNIWQNDHAAEHAALRSFYGVT